MVSEKLQKCKKRLLSFAQSLENKNDSQSMCEYIENEFLVLAEELDFLNVFTADERKLLESNEWRIDKNDLGLATISNYLYSESITKDDNMYLYSFFDEQKGDLIVEEMPFVYLENLLNYRNGNLLCGESHTFFLKGASDGY